jgi:hypothetical protein
MPSRKQIEANRLNARKSTGPRSPQGKARSSMNALKSGIDAQSQIIRGETPAALDALRADYYDRFHPTAPEQRMLVDTLIDNEWLLRRFRIIEAQLWEYWARDNMDATQLAYAFRKGQDEFARLQRRIDSTQRNYRHALHELERLQAEEAAVDPQPEPLLTRTNNPAKPENGFVPQLLSRPAETPRPRDLPRPDSPGI